MSNWKRFTIGTTTFNARSLNEAKERLGSMVTTDTTSIEECGQLLNGWKMFNFNKWFKVKARNLKEAYKNGVNKLSTLTEADFQIVDTDSEDAPPLAGPPVVVRKTAVVSLNEKPSVGQNLYIIGIGDNEGGRFAAIAATCAADAWNEAIKQHSMIELRGATRLGMWQRVIVPVSTSKNWKAVDFTKNIDTPTHVIVDIPIYMGLSDEQYDGTETLKVDENTILGGVVKGKIDRIVLPGKMIVIGKEDKVETVDTGYTPVRNDFSLANTEDGDD